MLYYVKCYSTDATIYVTSDFKKACEICDLTFGTIVSDDKGNTYFSNIELPF